MYGGTAAGVDLLLLTLHQVWAAIVERSQELGDTEHQVHEEEHCGVANFSTRYRMNHPEASDEEVARYVVKCWRVVSDRLGVPIDHNKLASEFAEYRQRRGIKSDDSAGSDRCIQPPPGPAAAPSG